MHMGGCPLPGRGCQQVHPSAIARPGRATGRQLELVCFNSIHSSIIGARLYRSAGRPRRMALPNNLLGILVRTFVSAVAVLIGLVLAAVAVPAMWVDRNIVQEDGFVAFTAPLGKDPVFQERLAAAAVGSLGAERIPAALAGLVTPVLESAARSLTSMPGYPEAWTETLRKSHRLNFADPASLPAEADGVTSLTLDLAPLVGLVAQAGGGCHDPAAGGPGPVADHHRAARAPAGPRPGGRLRADGLRRGRRCPDRLRPGLRGRPAALDGPGRHRARNASCWPAPGSWPPTPSRPR